MICTENVLKVSLQDVLKMPWRRFCKTSRRRFEDVWKMSWRRLEYVFKTPWRRLAKTSSRRFEDIFKTSWRRLEDVWPRRIYWPWARRLEDVFWRRRTKVNIFVLIKTPWRSILKTKAKDVFIKTNAWWDNISLLFWAIK